MDIQQFNIQEVFQNMLLEFKNKLSAIAGDKYPQAKEALNSALQRSQERLEMLAKYYKDGEISKKFVMDRLEDEAIIWSSEGLSQLVLGEKVGEDVINSLIGILSTEIFKLKTT